MRYAIIFTLAVLAFNCSPQLSPDSSWGRQRWVVVEMKGVPVQQSGRGDAFINFQVRDQRFAGNGGCNQINGNYKIDRRSIKFTEILSTKMACPDLAFETAFLESLGRVESYEVAGDDIYLKRNREILLILRARAANN